MAKQSSGRKFGRKKRQPAFARWKERYNRGQGLKHRRKARRALEGRGHGR